MRTFLFTGKGVPRLLSQNSMAAHVPHIAVPDSSVATQWYTADLGTVLTSQAVFGADPFKSPSARQLCEQQFNSEYPDLQLLLNSAVNNDTIPLQTALLRLIELTSHMS
jgi:hypothetical protein